MADLRFDPIAGIWVAIARNRRERPMEYIPIERVHQQINCPFCWGNEEETPAPVLAYKPDGTKLTSTDDPSGWITRVIPNKYPSLIQTVNKMDGGPYDCLFGDGVQELVIPTPRHVSSISELTDKELRMCWTACQDRLQALRSVAELQHVMLFMNARSAAGASMEHIHFQIMGSPLLSPFLVSRHERNERNKVETGRSLVSSLLKWELDQGVRILQETEHFVMLCPFASRFSFQVWIVPRDPMLTFDRKQVDFNSELSGLCKQYIQRLEQLIEDTAYNLLLNLAPNKYKENEHWFIEIFPRLNRMAGYEIGTDIWVNPVPPETAAKRLSA